MRCLALADAMSEFGYRPVFLSAPGTVQTVPALARSGFPVLDVDARSSGADAARAAGVVPAAAAVVDHYGLTESDESMLGDVADKVLACEDIPGRRHAADLVIDPTPGRKAEAYAGHVAAGTTVLAGPSFAILGREWRRARPAIGRHLEDGPARVVVSMGSTDPANASARVLDACAAAGIAAEFIVVLGASAPHANAVRERGDARVVIEPDDLPGLIGSADLVLGASGTSSFERALLGVPAVTLVLYDNQRDLAAGFAEAGACVTVDMSALDDPRAFGELVAGILADAGRRAAMSRAGRAICDGRGVQRILCSLAGTLAARDGVAVTLRLAEAADEDWLLALQAQPQTRLHARDPRVPTREGHSAWMARMLADPRRLLAIVERGGRMCGFVRLDRLDLPDPAFEVSVAMDPAVHGLGTARAALGLIRRLAPGARLDASVLAANAPSQALFSAAGYGRVGEETFRSLPQ